MRLVPACVMLPCVFLIGGLARADTIDEQIQQAIEDCDRPQILLFIQIHTAPPQQHVLLAGWRHCWEVDVEAAWATGDVDVLFDLLAPLAVDPFLTPAEKAELEARINECLLEAIEEGLPDAEKDCDLDRLESYAAIALLLGDSDLLAAVQEAWVDCVLDAIQQARKDCDLDRLAALFASSLSDLFPFERHGEVQDAWQEAVLHCVKKALDGLSRDPGAPDWIDRWVDLFEILLGDLVDGKDADRAYDHALDVLAKWYEHRIREASKKPCDEDALDELEEEIENDLLQPKARDALLDKIAKARRKC